MVFITIKLKERQPGENEQMNFMFIYFNPRYFFACLYYNSPTFPSLSQANRTDLFPLTPCNSLTSKAILLEQSDQIRCCVLTDDRKCGRLDFINAHIKPTTYNRAHCLLSNQYLSVIVQFLMKQLNSIWLLQSPCRSVVQTDTTGRRSGGEYSHCWSHHLYFLCLDYTQHMPADFSTTQGTFVTEGSAS